MCNTDAYMFIRYFRLLLCVMLVLLDLVEVVILRVLICRPRWVIFDYGVYGLFELGWL